MPRLTLYVEDADVPLVFQFGTPRDPHDLTGRTPRILLRDLATNQRIDTNHTVVQDPPTLGRAERPWQDGEAVAGRVYVVEAVRDYPDGQTYPDGNQQPLEILWASRRTTPVPP